jgi:hypothetical protein
VIGSWSETWMVGTQTAGTFGFTVGASPTSSAPPAPSGSGTSYPSGSNTGSPPPPTGGTQQQNTQPAPASGSTGLPDTIAGIPTNYVLLGGAGILVLALLGGRR